MKTIEQRRGTERAWSRGKTARVAASATAGFGAIGLAFVLAGPAGASVGERSFAGTVESVGAQSFTLARGVATITVDVGTSTKYFDHAVSAPSLAAVTAGEHVLVRGTIAGTDTLDASAVRVMSAVRGIRAERHFAGTVASVGTQSFTLTRGVATITVDVGTSTKYLDHGVSAPSLAAVTAGEHVVVRGTMAGTDTLDASAVRILHRAQVTTPKA